MWFQYEHRETLDNGDKALVKVGLNDSKGELYIYRVALIPKGKRKVVYLKDILTDEYSYRRLNTEDRGKAEIKRYVERVGLQVLNNALMAAWENMKPKLIDDEDYNIEY